MVNSREACQSLPGLLRGVECAESNVPVPLPASGNQVVSLFLSHTHELCHVLPLTHSPMLTHTHSHILILFLIERVSLCLVLGNHRRKTQIGPALRGLQASEEWAHTVMTQPGAGCKGQAQGPGVWRNAWVLFSG